MKDYEKMTVKELVDELTNLGVTFNKKSRKAELIELLHSHAGDTAPEERNEEALKTAEPSEDTPAKSTDNAASKSKATKKSKAEIDTSHYAIVRTGGKQYQVSVGSLVRVEKLAGEVGDTVELSDVLAVVENDSARLGQPLVDGAKVTARIIEQGKAKKVLVFKKKRRKGYRVKRGHRQHYTALEIGEISG